MQCFKHFILSIALALTVQPSHGQTISVQVKVVNVVASVRDQIGRPVANLKPEDFLVEEDGRLQSVKYFANESDLPLSIGLLVDVSASQEPVLEEERRASAIFLEQMLGRPEDQAFIIRFGEDVDLLQDFTASTRKLKSTLGQLRPPGSIRVAPSNRPCRGFSMTPLYDAIAEGSAQMKKRRAVRKALVVLTDGVDHNSCESVRGAIENAQRADTIVYVILFARVDSRWRKLQEDRRLIMEKITLLTGGRLFDASAGFSIDQIYSTIEEDLRQRYSLGYSSDRPTSKSEYRRIRVTVSKPGLSVIARDGYYTDKPDDKHRGSK